MPPQAGSRRHRPYGRGAPVFNRYKLRKLSALNIDWPIKQERLYPRAQPLIVEIGFGNGDFLIHLAQTQPDCNILGFEVSSQSMDKAEAKIDKLGLTNARAIHSRAETALNCLLPARDGASVSHQLSRSLVQEEAPAPAPHPARHRQLADKPAGRGWPPAAGD